MHIIHNRHKWFNEVVIKIQKWGWDSAIIDSGVILIHLWISSLGRIGRIRHWQAVLSFFRTPPGSFCCIACSSHLPALPLPKKIKKASCYFFFFFCQERKPVENSGPDQRWSSTPVATVSHPDSPGFSTLGQQVSHYAISLTSPLEVSGISWHHQLPRTYLAIDSFVSWLMSRKILGSQTSLCTCQVQFDLQENSVNNYPYEIWNA